MPALMSFDCEFSHPVPRIGCLLQIGIYIVPWDPETMSVVKHEVPGKKLKVTFPMREGAVVTDWVKENQKLLLVTSTTLRNTIEQTRAKVVSFLKECKATWGDITPAGWCLGSDMAYLLDLLGEDNDVVSYSAIDLKGVIIPLQHAIDPGDKETAAFLGVDKNENEHDALADAEYQMRCLLAALKRSVG